MAPPTATAALRSGGARRARRKAQAPPRRSGRRRFVRPLVVALILIGALAATYRFWLRDSSLVAVEDVRVQGATANVAEVRAALEGAASEMTTLHVDLDRLQAAVAEYPTVRSLSVDRDLPHGMTIEVHEQQPAAVVGEGDDAVAVAADGTLLTGLPPGGLNLPRLDAAVPEGGALDGAGRDQAVVLGAAPPPLRRVIEHSAAGADGVKVVLRGGVELRFGAPSDAVAKWRSAAAVLADPQLTALTYMDLSVPERPAVGGDPRASTPAEAPTTLEPAVP